MPIPKPDLKKATRAQELRKKKLTIREIARVMKKDPKTVYRWLQYDVGKLSTGVLADVGK